MKRRAPIIAWSVGGSETALMVIALVLNFVDRHASFPAGYINWEFADILNHSVNLAVPILGIVLASKKPKNPIGWLFLVAGSAIALQAFGTAYGLHALVVAPGSLPAGRFLAWTSNSVSVIPICMLSFLFLLFPTGHLPSRRWRPAAWSVGIIYALLTMLFLVTSSLTDPFGITSAGPSGLVATLIAFPFLAGPLLGVVAVIVRYRRSSGDERLQLRWFVTGAVLVVGTFVLAVASSPTSSTPPILSILYNLAILFLLVTIAIAILKYRLYEIDFVINKAVVYGVLAAFFTVVYVAIVVGIGSTVGSSRNPFLTLLAAAVIALAFNPVRDRAKRLANRIAYGKRATPYEVLSQFSDEMAGNYSLEEVLPRTAQMLAQGTGAARADVWLLSGTELVDEATWPLAPKLDPVPVSNEEAIDVAGAARAIPVRHQGALLGAISVHKSPGDPVSAVEDKLLLDVASQAGLVLRNVRLIEDLKASRQRIVAAQDEERRRIERNIHDGAQQQLVALAVKLKLAQTLAPRDPEKTEEMLSQLKADAQDALENLRDLARGIYPPLLADQGLVSALEAQARKSAVPATVESHDLGRFPQETEAAVYFCTLEALQNVAKYSQASRVVVRLSAPDGHLSFSVEDDGVGFDPDSKGYGTGLQGMIDRLAALGGELHVRSEAGAGTLVEGSLPVAGLE